MHNEGKIYTGVRLKPEVKKFFENRAKNLNLSQQQYLEMIFNNLYSEYLNTHIDELPKEHIPNIKV